MLLVNLPLYPHIRDANADAKWKENLNAPMKDGRPQTEVRERGRLCLRPRRVDIFAGCDGYEGS